MASRDCIADDATGLIGNTPMVHLKTIGKGLPGNVAAKLEYMNPACSVKDRIAYNMVRQAEEDGRIKPGVTTIIEPTSGNTGIGLAFVGAARGYRVIITMPETASLERRVLIKAYGAELVLTDPALGVKGVIDRANDLQTKIPNSVVLAQFDNPANPSTHYATTGPEIWRQTNGKVDVCVFGIGTGGTITGVGKFLREKNPNIKIFAVEPEESPVLSGGEAGKHMIQGIGAGIIPSVLDTELYDEVIKIHSDDAIAMAKRMAREEGILCGISSGANVTAAMRVASRPEMAGKLIVTVTPSFGERYLSTPLFSDVREESVAMKAQSLEENLSNLKLKHFEIVE